MQARSTIIEGFTLFETLIAMFILSLMVTVVLKHHLFLLDAQHNVELQNKKKREAHNQALLSGL
jgi:prepilin-type N-terminal cleavage/methylation domain-containing protein